MDDELTDNERAALDAWRPLAPPAGFADRVLAAEAPPVAKRPHRALVAGGIAAALVVAAAAVLVIGRSPRRAASGSIAAQARTTAVLGDRGVAVAEATASLTWRVDDHGLAEVEQRAGNVFYRIERGEPFVVHTPAGDVRVTGTCFRIEVEPMKPSHKMIMSGAAGAALASAVLVTVYEGHVVAETKSSRTELPAGSHATLAADGTTTTGTAVAIADAPFDLAHATREELVARAGVQQDQILRLRNRLTELETKGDQGSSRDRPDSSPEPGRLWHDPSPERLAAWAADCHIRFDTQSLEGFTPLKSTDNLGERGLEAKELDAYNTTVSEIVKQWHTLVRSLYLDATGDTAGSETLSIEGMQREIYAKSSREEMGTILEKIARERAGLAAPPTDTSKLSPLERFMRAYAQIGDQTEAALAKRIGDKRAHEIRGDGWESRSDMSGCNRHP